MKPTTAAALAPPTPEAREAAWRPLSVAEKAGLAREILVTYARVRYWLRRYELDEVVRLLRDEDDAEAKAPDGEQFLHGVRLARIVRRTLGVLPADSRCLVRSLVLSGLLARRGIAAALVIGVRTEPDFEAHAWVECAGYPLLPIGSEQYERLLEL
jgi:hypothetical protein